MKEELRNFTLKLSQTKGVGPKTFQQLIERYGDIKEMYKNADEVSQKTLLDMSDDSYTTLLKKESINYVCVWEETFPENLKNIADPPIVIFYRGNWDKDKIDNSISIVGTRDISSYGKVYTKMFSSELTLKGYSIVSGMALGVDREAHQACIDSGGYTIAVLASSANRPTPYHNSNLYKEILDSGGLVLSELFPGKSISPGLFPNRNRIVAGLSLGVLVIEAGEKSGALITANLAFGYNREVFAVPGNLGNKVSEGTNSLIRDSKAKLVKSSDDILIEFGHLRNNSVSIEHKKPDLSFEEDAVYNTLLSEAKLPEEIALKISKSIQEVTSVCSLLELRNIISKDDSGKYFIN